MVRKKMLFCYTNLVAREYCKPIFIHVWKISLDSFRRERLVIKKEREWNWEGDVLKCLIGIEDVVWKKDMIKICCIRVWTFVE